jgi:mRNA interferase HigB
VRIVKEPFLASAAKDYPKAASFLETWRRVVKAARWHSLADVRQSYPAADLVRVQSGRNVLVFNVCGNTYRLIVAVHFNSQIVYTLRFLTHADYGKDTWKDEL